MVGVTTIMAGTNKVIARMIDNRMPDLMVSLRAIDPTLINHKVMVSVPVAKDTLNLRSEASETIAAHRWTNPECRRRHQKARRRMGRPHLNTEMRDQKCHRRSFAARGEREVRLAMVVPERIRRQRMTLTNVK